MSISSTTADPFVGDARPMAISTVETAIFEGEAVLFDDGTSLTHLLDGVTAAVWLLCDGSTTVDDLTEEISALFDTPAPDAGEGRHVGEAIRSLADAGLLVGFERPAPPPCIGCHHG